MSEFIETKFNSALVGDIALRLVDTEVVLIGNSRNDHVKYKKGDECKRFFVPDSLKDELKQKGYTISTYPDWETYATWEDLEDIPVHTLSTPEINVEINGADITLTHFNARMRFFTDTPDAMHVEYLQKGTMTAFRPPADLLNDMFAQEYPAIYMPNLQLDNDSTNWYKQSEAA